MRPAVLALAVGVALGAAGAAWSEEAPNGAALALACAACHGTDGVSPGAIPSIRGKSAAYIEEALTDFKAGTRPSTVMNRLAKSYSTAEIKALAVFFSSAR
ncbi:MAG TPA: c-type cytochrome [Alphaproteobacteria bacterium]